MMEENTKKRPDIRTLGICKKAGKLICGFDPVLKELEKRETSGQAASEDFPWGILLVSDLSKKTEKNLMYHIGKLKRPPETAHFPFTMEQVGKITGKRCGILMITEGGLWKSLTG